MMNRNELLRLRREYEYHVANHPSERWEAKLETINLVLSWHEDAGSAPAQGSAEASRRTTFSNFPNLQPRRGELAPPPKPRREGAPAGQVSDERVRKIIDQAYGPRGEGRRW